MFNKKFLMKSIFIIMISIFLTACGLSTNNANTNEEGSDVNNYDTKVTMYYFWGDGCPYCATQKIFLDEMKNKYPNLEIKMYETWKNRNNAQMLTEMAQAYNTKASGVPMTFIGDFEPTVGFSAQTEKAMEDQIIFCLEEGCLDPGLRLK